MKPEHYIPTQVYYKILNRIPLKERVKNKKRANVGTLDDAGDEKIYSRKLILKKGYDKGGAYWEPPKNSADKDLYVDYTVNMKYVCFIWREEGSHLKKHNRKYSTVVKSDSVIKEILLSPSRDNVGNREEAIAAKKRIYSRKLFLDKGIDSGGHYWGKGALVVLFFTEDKSFILWEKPNYGPCEKAKQLLK